MGQHATYRNGGLFIVYVNTPNFTDPSPIQIFDVNGNFSTVSNFISPAPAPLPASWTMMLSGLAAFGLVAAYRRRGKVVSAAVAFA